MSFLTAGWTFVITGSLFIGIGGFLTTKGWSEFSNHSSRQALVSAAISELRQNATYLSDMDLANENLNKLENVYLLPRFQFDAIRQIPSSHLFREADGNLQQAASSLVYNIGPTNDSILKLNISFSGTIASLETKKETFRGFYSSALLSRFRAAHQELHRLLEAEP